MPAATAEGLDRRRMSLAEFEALPEGVHAEYLGGSAVMSPPPDIPHQALAGRLVALFSAALPGLVTLAEGGLRTVGDGRRIPDVMVLESEEDSVWAEQPPVLVVEVTSRATRAEDTLRKPGEYALAGTGQYWLVDRDRRTLTVSDYSGGSPAVVLELGDDHPSGEVRVGGYGVVQVDLGRLLPRPTGS